MTNRDAGFTLIEVMIVVAIIGILASIAYPSYVEHVRKSKRAECQTVLLNLANALERRYSMTNSYIGAIPAGFATCPANGGGVFYNVAFVGAPTATTFTVMATRAGSQAGDRCGNLTLNNQGVKGVVSAAAGVTAQQCW